MSDSSERADAPRRTPDRRGPVDVCIVSTQHPARNPRAVKEADALAGAGLEVRILTIASHAPSLTLDTALLRGRRWSLRYGVNLLGRSAPERVRSLVLRLGTRAARRWLQRTGFEFAAALGPMRSLLSAALAQPARLYVAHVDGGIWVGSRLLRAGRNVAADFEDWYSEDLLPRNRRTLPVHLLRAAEGALLRRAAYVTAPSEAMAAALARRYGGNVPQVVPNAFPLQPDPHRPAEATGLRSLLWFSQTIGPGRGLDAFVQAWAATRQDSRLVLLGHPQTDYVDHLRAFVPLHRRDRFVVQAAVAPEALPGCIAQHDIGLALEPTAPPNKDLTISNKLLQYLNAGLAILATRTAGQAEALSCDPELDTYIDLADPAALARQIDELISDEATLARRQRAARRLAESRYCWERYAPDLAARALAALGTRAP